MCVLVEIVGNSERGEDGIIKIKGMRKLPYCPTGILVWHSLMIMSWMQEDYDVGIFFGYGIV